MIKLIFTILFVQLFCGYTYACNNGLDMSLNSSVNLSSLPNPALQVQVTKNSGSSAACSFFIVIDNGGASSFSNRVLIGSNGNYPIQFYSDSTRTTNIIKPLANATTNNDIVVGSLTGSTSSANVFYYPSINTSGYFRSGNYTNEFNVSLYRGTLSSRTLMKTIRVRFTYNSPVKTDVSLVNTGSAFDVSDNLQNMDFGVLSTGESQSFDIVLKYNSGYRLSMKSDNASGGSGRLKNTTSNNYITYSATLNGNTISLSTSFTQLLRSGNGGGDDDDDDDDNGNGNTYVSPSNGRRIPMRVTIGNVTGARPGDYKDTVSISISTL